MDLSIISSSFEMATVVKGLILKTIGKLSCCKNFILAVSGGWFRFQSRLCWVVG